MVLRAELDLPPELRPPPLALEEGEIALRTNLTAWARACPRPLVLLLDEIDALRGQSLIRVLRQLRSGFPDRPGAFPASVVLCGVRDVRDYKAASGGDPERLGTANPFNIKLKSLRLGDFTREEVLELYTQHTMDTGQRFTEQALARAYALTQGQPWLVNALAREIVEEMAVPACEPITAEHVGAAKERLILARATHLDSLVARLHEPRIRRVLEPVLAGTLSAGDAYLEDLQYARGLSYHEVAPQLVLMAFLQRVVNGGGFVEREYGAGRGRIDLLVRWPYTVRGQRHLQRHTLELKVWREGQVDPLAKGLAQLDAYLQRLGLDEGVLVIFDRRAPAAQAEPRTRFEQAQAPSSRRVTVLRA